MSDISDSLFEKYGPKLTLNELAEVLKTSAQNIRKDICKQKFPIKTYKDKAGRRAPRYADYRDVAEYLDLKRASAHPQSQLLRVGVGIPGERPPVLLPGDRRNFLDTEPLFK